MKRLMMVALFVSWADDDGGVHVETRVFTTNGTDTPIPVQGLYIDEDENLIVSDHLLLDFFSDVEGDSLDVTAVSINGTSLTPSGDTWTFTPEAHFFGHLNMQVTVSDGYFIFNW